MSGRAGKIECPLYRCEVRNWRMISPTSQIDTSLGGRPYGESGKAEKENTLDLKKV